MCNSVPFGPDVEQSEAVDDWKIYSKVKGKKIGWNLLYIKPKKIESGTKKPRYKADRREWARESCDCAVNTHMTLGTYLHTCSHPCQLKNKHIIHIELNKIRWLFVRFLQTNFWINQQLETQTYCVWRENLHISFQLPDISFFLLARRTKRFHSDLFTEFYERNCNKIVLPETGNRLQDKAKALQKKQKKIYRKRTHFLHSVELLTSAGLHSYAFPCNTFQFSPGRWMRVY